MHDSARWEGFPFRDGDIVISTPAKSGTTWMQMICALLVFQTPSFDRPLAELSPWLDMLTADRARVFATLDAQTHRRFQIGGFGSPARGKPTTGIDPAPRQSEPRSLWGGQ